MPIKETLNVMRLIKILLFVGLGISLNTYSETAVNLLSRDDLNAHYAIGVIKLGLDKAQYPYRLAINHSKFTEERYRQDAQDGIVDIIWSAANQTLEKQLIPIRVPLYKGLLGYRIFMVHKNNKNIFAKVHTLEDLQKFTFGQGRIWPDTLILRANGLKVETSTYEGLFLMLDGNRFDAFPRAIFEPWAEIEARPNLNLAVDENIVLAYKMPFYLYVSPKKPELAIALEKGLLMAVADGSFDRYFYNDPTVKKALEISDIKKRRVIELKNPNLSDKTPVNNDELWLDISQFNKNH
ncbi:MAG: diguanylate cyclase [Pseudomonadota bacterium]